MNSTKTWNFRKIPLTNPNHYCIFNCSTKPNLILNPNFDQRRLVLTQIRSADPHWEFPYSVDSETMKNFPLFSSFLLLPRIVACRFQRYVKPEHSEAALRWWQNYWSSLRLTSQSKFCFFDPVFVMGTQNLSCLRYCDISCYLASKLVD